jgi:hypothetical protein
MAELVTKGHKPEDWRAAHLRAHASDRRNPSENAPDATEFCYEIGTLTA